MKNREHSLWYLAIKISCLPGIESRRIGVVQALTALLLIGFVHGLRYGRQSLPLDLIEEFRQPVVDGLGGLQLRDISYEKAY